MHFSLTHGKKFSFPTVSTDFKFCNLEYTEKVKILENTPKNFTR